MPRASRWLLLCGAGGAAERGGPGRSDQGAQPPGLLQPPPSRASQRPSSNQRRTSGTARLRMSSSTGRALRSTSAACCRVGTSPAHAAVHCSAPAPQPAQHEHGRRGVSRLAPLHNPQVVCKQRRQEEASCSSMMSAPIPTHPNPPAHLPARRASSPRSAPPLRRRSSAGRSPAPQQRRRRPGRRPAGEGVEAESRDSLRGSSRTCASPRRRPRSRRPAGSRPRPCAHGCPLCSGAHLGLAQPGPLPARLLLRQRVRPAVGEQGQPASSERRAAVPAAAGRRGLQPCLRGR